MRVIVFGSRNWTDYKTIYTRLSELPPDTIVVHGACYPKADKDGNRPMISADWLCELACGELGLQTEPHPADWDKHGRAAGPIRNAEVADLGADRSIGFRSPGKSNGTDDMDRQCKRVGVPFREMCFGT